jgi:hypothetical protein
MEKHVHIGVTNYLKLQYTGIPFRSDYGAGARLTIGQAKMQKSINNGMAWPDLFIASSRHGKHGLFIELKDHDKPVTRQNGKWVSDHVAEQAKCLRALQEEGYEAQFAVGFDNAKGIIDWYLNS